RSSRSGWPRVTSWRPRRFLPARSSSGKCARVPGPGTASTMRKAGKRRRHKRAIVIGGTSGIGRSIALPLLGGGFEVVAAGKSRQSVEAFPVRKGLGAEQLDVSDLGAVDALFGTLTGADVLVNCAGTNRRRGLEFDPEVFEHVIRVNLLGT